ncbi:MAG: ROK family protein [Friedmanniella sp.]
MPPGQLLRARQRSGGAGDLRHGNLTQILRYVRDHGPSSRQDIARGCGLGISTMTDLIGELRARRLVRELDAVRGPRAGRPTRPIDLDGDPWCVLGAHVDLLEVQVLCTTVGGREIFRERIPVPLLHTGAEAGYALLRSVLCSQLGRIPEDLTLVAVQLGLPGYVAADRGIVSSSSFLGWDGMPLETLVYDTLYSAGFENVTVGIGQDSHLAALHAVREELRLPLPRLAVYVGGLREVGGAVVLDGEIFQGADGGAGDFGHAHVDPEGPLCSCGRHGCLNSLIGPTYLLVQGGLADQSGAEQLVVEDPYQALRRLADAGEAGDRQVLAVLARAGTALGRALDDVIGALNPDVVALGGYLAVLQPFLLDGLQDQISRRLRVEAFAGTALVTLARTEPRVSLGAALAARDACLSDPLNLTHVV